MHLSKTDYNRYLQCPRLLWLSKNRKELAAKPDEVQQAIFDQGHLVESYADKMFEKRTKEESVTIEGWYEKGQKEMQNHINQGKKLIFQANALPKDLYCKGDILHFNDTSKKWDLYEVKSTTSVKPEHIPDLCFQKIAFERDGIEIDRTYLVHLNKKYVKNGEIVPEELFVIEDLTEDVENLRQITETKLTSSTPETNSEIPIDGPTALERVEKRDVRDFIREEFGKDIANDQLNKEEAFRLIEMGYAETATLLAINGRIDDCNKELAIKLASAGQAREVALNVNKFTGRDYELAIHLIYGGAFLQVFDRLDEFPDMNIDRLAQNLVAKGNFQAIPLILRKYEGIDGKVALAMIKTKRHPYIGRILRNLEKFKNIDYNEIAQTVSEFDIDYLATHLEYFPKKSLTKQLLLSVLQRIQTFKQPESSAGSVDQIAQKIKSEARIAREDEYKERIDNHFQGNLIKFLGENLDKFRDLDKEVALGCINAGLAYIVVENPDTFSSDTEVAIGLIKNGLGQLVCQKSEQYREFDVEQIRTALNENNQEILITFFPAIFGESAS